MLEIEFPEHLSFLITEPARYKVLYGGRGAGKTEGIAMALIILAIQLKLRILCLRELQNSIQESVHETIKNQIVDMGLEEEFNILDKTIVSKRTGSEFIFSGLRYNINKIKSMSRIDIAWVEEAINVSKTSWEKLGPTIRGRHKDDPNGMGGPFKQGPEIWISFNPELDTDETYARFVLKRDKYAPDFLPNEDTGEMERYAIVKKTNWSDNKWFPRDLKRDMLLAKEQDETAWLNVWEGHTKQVLDGAIYADEIKKVLVDGRRGKVSYDPSKPVYTFWDLGHSDQTAIWFVQRIGMDYNLINYYQNNLKKIGFYLEHLQKLGYVYGTFYMPHDADSETLAARSIANITRAAGFKVVVVPRVAKKVLGINAARTVFDLCNFDEENTSEGWQCLCRYSYDVDDNGKLSKEPAHNEWSHGADAFQTFALSLKTEKEVDSRKKRIDNNRNKVINFRSSSWMNS